jgi:hypothetical protein
MTRSQQTSLVFLACLAAPGELSAQRDSIQTPDGMCAVRAPIPGVSSPQGDASYNRCALDQGPSLHAGEPMPPAPWLGTSGGGSFTVIVNADGTVDPRLTRAWSRSADTLFYRNVLETIRNWRFEPGVRQGVPVRSGFPLEVRTGTRVDTLPSRLEWSYRQGVTGDSLVGTWRTEARLPPFSPQQTDSIHAAMLRRLKSQKVIVPGFRRRYCLVLPERDSAEHARLSRIFGRIIVADQNHHGFGAAGYGCERNPETLRIIMPRIYRTENGRAVLYPRGDFLPSWPAGFDGRSYRAWTARCVADVRGQAPDWIDCSVRSVFEPEESAQWMQDHEEMQAWLRRRPSREASTADSVAVTVLARMRDAYQIDTMRAVARPLPRLSAGAVQDSAPPCCWTPYSASQDSTEMFVAYGDPRSSSLYLADVLHQPLPENPVVASGGSGEPNRAEFVAFLLGDPGEAPLEPITLCLSRMRCGRRYVLYPARHLLADKPVLQFRIADLREGTRIGEQLHLRIYADPAPDDLVPFVVVRSEGRLPARAYTMRRVGMNAWDYGVTYGEGFPMDGELSIYLFGR